MLTLKQLRCFVAVAEEGHFNRAALRLGMSQPPVSEHVRQLENLLNCRLFERTTRDVLMTKEGAALLDHARQILVEVDRTREVITTAGGAEDQRIKLGLLHAHTYTFFPALLEAFMKFAPHTSIELVEYTTVGQRETILSGLADVGLVREPVVHPDLKTQTLFTEPYVLASPSRWRLKRTVTAYVCHNRTLIGYPSHDDKRSTRSLFGDFLRRHAATPSAYREVTTMHSALALVAAGIGLAPVPQSQAALKLHGVSYHHLGQDVPHLSVGLAWRSDTKRASVRDFIEFAADYFQALKAAPTIK